MKLFSYCSHDIKMMMFYLSHAVLIFTKVISLCTFGVWLHHQLVMPFLQREIIFVTSCLLPLTMEQFRNRFFSYRKEFASKGAN